MSRSSRTSASRRLGVCLGWLAGILLVTAHPQLAAAQQRVSQVWSEANAASARGDYEKAIADYRELIEAGVRDPDVDYDLATSFAQTGQYGRAILYFERALTLRPGDDGAERGLKTAREALGKQRAERTGEAVVDAGPPFPEVLVRDVSADQLAWALLALDVLLFGVLLVRRFVRGDSPRLALGVAAPVLALLLVGAGFGLVVKKGLLREGRAGIVLEEDAVLREGPDPRAAERGEADEGERVRVLDRHGDYVHVRIGGQREGWMKASKVAAI